MTLQAHFRNENFGEILIYHYVEELVRDFTQYCDENYDEELIPVNEMPFLLRIRFKNKGTQKDLVKLFHVSNGQVSKILRKFEEKGLIKRKEDPESRRRKIVELTENGIENTNRFIEYISDWENSHGLSVDELETLKKLLYKFLMK